MWASTGSLFIFSKDSVEDVCCTIPSNADICAAWGRASKRAHTMNQAQVGLHVAIRGTVDDLAIVQALSAAVTHCVVWLDSGCDDGEARE